MSCPRCGNQLNPFQKYGIQIDVCAGCGGVWLDRGELDKLLAMEAGRVPGRAPEYQGEYPGGEERGPIERYSDPTRRGYGRDDEPVKRHGYDRRRRSLLGELFGAFGGDDD